MSAPPDGRDRQSVDPDLPAAVAAWPTLAAPLRAAVLALVKTAESAGPGSAGLSVVNG